MKAYQAFKEETRSLDNEGAPSGVPAFIQEIDFLRELALGEVTTQDIFEMKQTLHRLGVIMKTLRPEATAT